MSVKTFFYVTVSFMILAGMVPVVIGISRHKLLDLPKRLILALMICSVAANVVQVVLGLYKINNLFMSHLYVLAEFCLIAYIYKIILNKFIPTQVFWVMFSGFIAFSLFNAFYIQGWQGTNSYQRTIECVLLFFVVLLYFYKTLKELQVQQIEREPMFWFSGGLLLYFAGALFIFIFSNYLLRYSQDLGITFWIVHDFFLILFYISATIALWINPKK